MIYADLEFYKGTFLAGDTQIIPDSSFVRRAREASAYIAMATFNRVEDMEEVPAEVKHATCELAELYHASAQASSVTAKRSESVGAYSVSYADQTQKPDELNASLRAVLVRWLGNTGLLYRGVD